MTHGQAFYSVLCAFQASAHSSYSRLPTDEEAGGQTGLALPINLLWFLCNKQDLLSWKLPSCKITFAWNSQPPATILQQIFQTWTLLSASMSLPNAHPGFEPSLHSWAHFLVLLQCWDMPRRTQSKQRNSVYSTNALPSLFCSQCINSHSHACAPQIQTSILISHLHVVPHL